MYDIDVDEEEDRYNLGGLYGNPLGQMRLPNVDIHSHQCTLLLPCLYSPSVSSDSFSADAIANV